MYYVYLLESLKFTNKIYIGYTENLKQRLYYHNQGKSYHTAKYKPWKLAAYFYFTNQEKAVAFEKYLKSQSGREFIKKRIW